MTEKGLRLLRRANLDAEIEVWRRVYDRLERTDRIEAMEGRPTPDWDEAGATDRTPAPGTDSG